MLLSGDLFQIYDMILVRHGLMVVGDPIGGKTSGLKVLAGALGDLNSQQLMDEYKVGCDSQKDKSHNHQKRSINNMHGKLKSECDK